MASYTKEEALDYHRLGRPGKIEVVATKPLTTQLHLSLAYSPGVAEACLAIKDDPMEVYHMTARGNLVAVVSNGTAVLGLGNLGPLGAKPVMEGKGVLFKSFADVDVFDIEIDARTAEEVINVCRALAPTFGGINLEDIKAPECFEIEETLKAELDIPVFHDDQHGTAIISGAGMLSACEIIGKKPEDLKVVVVGAGASAIASAEFYVLLGVKRENVIMSDSRGIIHSERTDLNKYKAAFATKTNIRTLEDAFKGADVALGLSVAGSIKKEWVATMAENPIIFAMANPTPEVMPEEVAEVRSDALMGTGRSDYPNQVNNVLGFPFIFRGALDVFATGINEEMKLAAAHALCDLAHEDVPDSVLNAYGLKSLKFGRDYLIPKPLDPRVLMWVAPAVAKAAMDSGVARRELDMDTYRDMLIKRKGMGMQVRSTIVNRAKAAPNKRVVFAEGDHPKIIRAAYRLQDEGIATPILLGNKAEIMGTIQELGLEFAPEIRTPYDAVSGQYVDDFLAMRGRKGVTRAQAESLMHSRTHYGLMMVKEGDADAFVSGLEHEYPEVIRPALQIFGSAKGVDRAAGVYLTIAKNKVYLFSDPTINIDPDAETLANIAILANDYAMSIDMQPVLGMLSFSNFGSTPHPLSNKVEQAVKIVKERRPDIRVDGPMQADTAVSPALIKERFPFSEIEEANVLIFPDLGSANVAYKLLENLTDAEAIGPILVGIGGPVQLIDSSSEVDDIVTVAAIAAYDAHVRG